ncbi:hypothetical protein E2C01_012281 [Portunus trituberculatus]|uniref:Uncharacterized protein n=1 Tax=Portunus trituberculatus TaxID=210409 RepID=A0A5B7DDJ0_PORTR|nr:hypothetical protein [Portunus trituberculatus]
MGITPARTAAPAAEGTVGLPTGTLLPTTVGPVTRSTAGPLTGTLLPTPAGTSSCYYCSCCGREKHTRAFVKRLAPHPSKNSSSSRRHSRALAGAMLPTPERRAPVGGTSGPLAGIPLLATAGGTTSPPAGAHLLATAGTATAGGGAVDPPGRSPAPCHSRNSNSSKRHSMAAC